MSDTTPEKGLVDSVSPSASNGSNTSNPLNNSSPQPLKSNESDKNQKSQGDLWHAKVVIR